MKLKNFILYVLVFTTTLLAAQVAPSKYYIQFTDKNDSPYSINQPEAFLSQRAIDRRSKYDIPVAEEDLPVNPDYLVGVAATGAVILNPTKWMNGVTIFTEDQSVLDAIMALPYVENMVKLADYPKSAEPKDFFKNESLTPVNQSAEMKSGWLFGLDYGLAGPQIAQINGAILHDRGYKGEGMLVAVLDGGFSGTDVHPFFDSLRMNNRIIATKDFVNKGGSVFTDSGHGNSVLSTMAAFSPGEMIGTAPRASYLLLRPEDVNSENIIEEYNWVSAAEYADSAGADVINSSLGYIDFDNPAFDHTYEDMDGITNVCTRGADKAVSKGLMVVNSAGNSGGNSSFPYIGAPADGFDVFSIGAVDPNGYRASFSSIGPTYDGRIKPVIAATGQSTFVAYGGSDAGYGNGTSFSSPIIAGMTTCLMQGFPEMSAIDIMEALKESGSQHSAPDNLLGWGIPDYGIASDVLTTIRDNRNMKKPVVAVYPNPTSQGLTLDLTLDTAELVRIELVSNSGALLFKREYNLSNADHIIQIDQPVISLMSGVYYVRVITSDYTEVVKFVKQ